MADAPELEAPEIDIDPDGDRFRRIVAVVVSLIAFFGVFVATLQAVESNDEEAAARDAQRFAVTALGTDIDAQAQLLTDFEIATDALLLSQRQAAAFGRIRRGGETGDLLHQAIAEQFAQASAAVSALTPVDMTDVATQDAASAEAFDRPDVEQLLQRIRADQADDHGGKADSYVAVITVLAVGLFLIGLSLTVQGRVRWVLAGPGFAIAIVCVLVTGSIARRPVLEVSNEAAQLAADGQRALNARDYEQALALFDDAIDDSPDFFAPYARRAAALINQDADATNQVGFISFISEDVLEDALPDIERAIELGGDEDLGILVTASFLTFHDADFVRSAEFAQQAVDLNPSAVLPRLNLAVALMGQAEESGARRALRSAFDRIEQIPDEFTVTALLGALRTDLEVLRTLADDAEADEDDILELVELFEAETAAFEQELVCTGDTRCDFPDGNVSVELIDVFREGAFVDAFFAVDGAEPGEHLAFSWFFRGGDDQPFRQAAFNSMQVDEIEEFNGVPEAGTRGAALADPLCPLGTTYLVRVWAGDRLVGEVEFDVDPSPLAERFTLFEDPLLGFNICQPEGFEVTQIDDADLVGQFGPQVELNRDDQQIFPAVVRGFFDPEVFGLDTEEGLLDASEFAVESFFGQDDVDLEERTLLGRSLGGVFVDLPGVIGTSDNGLVTAFAAVDRTGTMRLIAMTNLSPEEVEDVLDLVFFFDLPEPEA